VPQSARNSRHRSAAVTGVYSPFVGGPTASDGTEGGISDIADVSSGGQAGCVRTRTVLVVLFDGVDALDVVSPVEVLTAANVHVARTTSDKAPYSIRTASPGGTPVRSPSGLTLVPDTDLNTATAPHTLLVPGPYGGWGDLAPDPQVVNWLRQHAARCRRIVSMCTGAFLLAQAGLLTGRRVTTHWSQADRLARACPGAQVDPDPIFIRDGRVSTSAGGISVMDLALALVEEDLGREAALTC